MTRYWYHRSFWVVVCIILFTSGSAFAQTASPVFVIEEDMPVPAGARLIEEISVRDKGFKINCGHDLVLEQAKEKVQKKGGNILKITRWKNPSAFGSTCYQVWGQAYFIDDPAKAIASTIVADTTTASLISDTAQYAVLYVYRPRSYTGSLLSYNVHVNDKALFKISNGSCDTFHVQATGPSIIWGTIETRSQVSLDIKAGKAYFIRCEIGYGVWAGRPHITIVEPNKGYKEYLRVRDR